MQARFLPATRYTHLPPPPSSDPFLVRNARFSRFALEQTASKGAVLALIAASACSHSDSHVRSFCDFPCCSALASLTSPSHGIARSWRLPQPIHEVLTAHPVAIGTQPTWVTETPSRRCFVNLLPRSTAFRYLSARGACSACLQATPRHAFRPRACGACFAHYIACYPTSCGMCQPGTKPWPASLVTASRTGSQSRAHEQAHHRHATPGCVAKSHRIRSTRAPFGRTLLLCLPYGRPTHSRRDSFVVRALKQQHRACLRGELGVTVRSSLDLSPSRCGAGASQSRQRWSWRQRGSHRGPAA